jgi:hypothetical protein
MQVTTPDSKMNWSDVFDGGDEYLRRRKFALGKDI